MSLMKIGKKGLAPPKAVPIPSDSEESIDVDEDEADVSDLLETGSASANLDANSEESSGENDGPTVPTPVYLSAVGKVMADGSHLEGLLKARYVLQLGPPTAFESEQANDTFKASVANTFTLENMAPQAHGIPHKGFVKEDT
ncbi:hypothetical protein FS837_002980 [Tulasnella sp. UAMH 9824]|nr:hypothetical protein FS837_002980 [Tulasnella sp. UAMH 9824]